MDEQPSAHWKVTKIKDGRATLENRADRRPHEVDARPDWKVDDIVIDTFRNGANVLERLA